MKNKNLSFMTQAAMIAAIYVVLTYIFAPFFFRRSTGSYLRGTHYFTNIYTSRYSGTLCRMSDR